MVITHGHFLGAVLAVILAAALRTTGLVAIVIRRADTNTLSSRCRRRLLGRLASRCPWLRIGRLNVKRVTSRSLLCCSTCNISAYFLSHCCRGRKLLTFVLKSSNLVYVNTDGLTIRNPKETLRSQLLSRLLLVSFWLLLRAIQGQGQGQGILVLGTAAGTAIFSESMTNKFGILSSSIQRDNEDMIIPELTSMKEEIHLLVLFRP